MLMDLINNPTEKPKVIIEVLIPDLYMPYLFIFSHQKYICKNILSKYLVLKCVIDPLKLIYRIFKNYLEY